MLLRGIAKIRKGLGMTQEEPFGYQLSQSRSGRQDTDLAIRVIEMLGEIGGMQMELIEKAEKVFDRLNAKCFGRQIKI